MVVIVVVVTGALVDTLVGTGLTLVVAVMVGKDSSCDVVKRLADVVGSITTLVELAAAIQKHRVTHSCSNTM